MSFYVHASSLYYPFPFFNSLIFTILDLLLSMATQFLISDKINDTSAVSRSHVKLQNIEYFLKGTIIILNFVGYCITSFFLNVTFENITIVFYSILTFHIGIRNKFKNAIKLIFIVTMMILFKLLLYGKENKSNLEIFILMLKGLLLSVSNIINEISRKKLLDASIYGNTPINKCIFMIIPPFIGFLFFENKSLDYIWKHLTIDYFILLIFGIGINQILKIAITSSKELSQKLHVHFIMLKSIPCLLIYYLLYTHFELNTMQLISVGLIPLLSFAYSLYSMERNNKSSDNSLAIINDSENIISPEEFEQS